MQNLRRLSPPAIVDIASSTADTSGAHDPSLTVTELRGDDLFDSFAMRYEVYCRDRQFLNADDYPEGLEIDEFDWFSSHVGVFDSLGRLLGTVRLVPASSAGLPMDPYCTYQRPPAGHYGEISRLAIPRHGRAASLLGQRNLSLRLYRGLYQIARANGMTTLLSAMEPSLERLVRRMHFPWEQIGPETDYHGRVRPYLLSLDALDAALRRHQPEIYELFQTPLDTPSGPNFKSHPIRDLLAIAGRTA